MKALVESGLVEGSSGRNGGYRLAMKPEDYSILEILEAANDSPCPVACLKPGSSESIFPPAKQNRSPG